MSSAIVGCAGIIVADTFCGPMAHLPAAGELLSVAHMPVSTGGCAANVALDLSRQGITTKLFGTIGNDGPAEGIIADLRSKSVDCASIHRHAILPTSATVILLVEGDDRRYIHSFGANAAFGINEIPRDALRGLKVFYLGGLGVLPAMDLSGLAALLAWCRQNGILTVVDVVVPQGQQGIDGLSSPLPHIDYFLPNQDEAARLTGRSDAHHQADALLTGGVRTVIITRGAAGAIAFQGENYWETAAYNMPAVDPSGSGDAFCGGIITGIVNQWEMPHMLRYASALGASATLQVGTTAGVFAKHETDAFIANNELTVKQGRRHQD